MKIYIGWDSREEDSFAVCQNSIEKHSSCAVTIEPIKQPALRARGLYQRPASEAASTEFTYTRFLVPALMQYQGWALFVDCDFLFTRDVAELFALRDERFALMCCQHDYVPSQSIKMDNQKQVAYPRKNWSSLVLWNCGHPANAMLTPDVVNTRSSAFLHRFQWLKDEHIGELPLEWNWLVGEYDVRRPLPAALHYTNGGPWFEECRECDYADEWLSALQETRMNG